MTLHEKILFCRKDAGLSQEALAERLGVSRQAISKWETGDATPELSKLVLLAKEFGVTTDWLLSEEETYEEPEQQTELPETGFGFIKRMVKKYGWLAGVYISISGIPFALFGWFIRFRLLKSLASLANVHYMAFDTELRNSPALHIGTIVMLIGIATIIAGILLAVFLKKKSKK